jgi:telomerase reverse transcriptase
VSAQPIHNDALERQTVAPQPDAKGHVVMRALPAQSHVYDGVNQTAKSKRKRKRPGPKDGGNTLEKIKACGRSNGKDPVVKQALLAQYYPQVFTLREFLLSKLPASSKVRWKKILSVGRKLGVGDSRNNEQLGEVLDSTLVGLLKYDKVSTDERIQQWASFSQRADTSNSTFANVSGVSVYSQSEVGVPIF